MAGRASAVPPASVLNVDLMTEQNIKNRARLSNVMKRCVARIELDQAIRLAAFENHTNGGHVNTNGSGFDRECEGIKKDLPIRPIFAMMNFGVRILSLPPLEVDDQWPR